MKNILKWYHEIGMEYVLKEEPINRLEQPSTSSSESQEVALQSVSRKVATEANTLEELKQKVLEFNGCAIKMGAINTVFADGNPSAEVMLIGEAPGANEDIQGIPFCGLSGKLLNNILLSISLKREDVYITNTVFWRPPGNRRPTAEEIEICRPLVEKHVALLQPKLIILVGNTAVESLLGLKVPMHSLRGKVFDYNNIYLTKAIKAVAIFHPSYLLRQPAKKKEMWQDVIRIKNQFLS